MSPDPDRQRERAILAATADLIVEHGWENLAMRAVADRAGVSLSTIYDRWPTKTDLAIAAVRWATRGQSWTLDSIQTLLAERANLMLCLLSIQRSQPERRPEIREHFSQALLEPLRSAAIDTSQGQLDDDTAAMIALLGPAYLFVRNIVIERPVTAEELQTLSELMARLAQSFE